MTKQYFTKTALIFTTIVGVVMNHLKSHSYH